MGGGKAIEDLKMLLKTREKQLELEQKARQDTSEKLTLAQIRLKNTIEELENVIKCILKKKFF